MQYLKLFNGEEQKQIRNFQFHLRDTESWKEHHCQAHDKKKLQSMAISSVPQRTDKETETQPSTRRSRTWAFA